MKDRIISLMKQMGMSQKVFASEICISEGSLSSIFSGRTKPTLNIVNNIHERFPEVNMGWLIDGKGEMFNSAPPGVGQTEGSEGVAGATGSQATGLPLQPGFMEQYGGVQQAGPQAPNIMPDAKNYDRPLRRIAEIRVFYDDGTFETFPAKA